MKYVRSESDPTYVNAYETVNVFNTGKTLRLSKKMVQESTLVFLLTKQQIQSIWWAPVNLLWKSFQSVRALPKKTFIVRFASVAFSDGSLLHGFNQRFAKKRPFSAHNDVRRYFETPQELVNFVICNEKAR